MNEKALEAAVQTNWVISTQNNEWAGIRFEQMSQRVQQEFRADTIKVIEAFLAVAKLVEDTGDLYRPCDHPNITASLSIKYCHSCVDSDFGVVRVGEEPK